MQGESCKSAARTDRGKVRERNEDAFLERPEHGVWVVADGMGGHQSGDVASQMIVRSVAGLVRADRLEQKLYSIRQCLKDAHQCLGQITAGKADGDSRVVGSTVVALLIEGHRAACVWAGDSRCYLWREQRLYQLSRDHSLLQRLIDREQMSLHQAVQHPNAHALTRAVGARGPLDLDVIELNIQPDDVFLLCSDGLYQALDHCVLGDALSLQTPQMALSHLFEHVLRGAACDNLTAVVVHT